MGRRRLTGGAALLESQEFHMGRIEAETYAGPCRRAGFSQEDAERYTLLYGLYPHWLVNVTLEGSTERAAHNAWLEGVKRSIESEYRRSPVPASIRSARPDLPSNPKAEARRAFVEAGRVPSAKARLEAIKHLGSREFLTPPRLDQTEAMSSQDAPRLTELASTPTQPVGLEAAFHEAMLLTYTRAGRELGYWPQRFRQAVMRHGGLGWARKELAKTRKGIVSEGFQRLLDAGRLDISVEALVVNPTFASLFSNEERRIAQARLKAYGPATVRMPVKPEDNFPEVVVNDVAYREGSVRSVTVNAYERSSKARAACLEHHGRSCAACEMDFEATYGGIGKDFIHVHHVIPLALMREAYSVDPVKDLVPVCPNCHAMLHTSQPPLSVYELKQVLQERREKVP